MSFRREKIKYTTFSVLSHITDVMSGAGWAGLQYTDYSDRSYGLVTWVTFWMPSRAATAAGFEKVSI